jgi:hypothetical protein
MGMEVLAGAGAVSARLADGRRPAAQLERGRPRSAFER